MDGLYKLFDRFTEMIPPQLLPVIRLAAILIWVLMAGIVAIMAWRTGSESAPQMGQELSLAEIKARQQREANLKKPPTVRVPDLNELLPEPALDSAGEGRAPGQGDASADQGPQYIESREDLMRAQNPVAEPGPRYSGEGLAPVGDDRPGLLPTGPQDFQPVQSAPRQNTSPLPQSTELLPLDERQPTAPARAGTADAPKQSATERERERLDVRGERTPSPSSSQTQRPVRKPAPAGANALPLLD